MTAETRLSTTGRALLSRVIDLDRFDTEMEFAEIERAYETEEGAA